jgi:hypothetical protein
MLCEIEGLVGTIREMGEEWDLIYLFQPSSKSQHPKMRGRSKEGLDVEPSHWTISFLSIEPTLNFHRMVGLKN